MLIKINYCGYNTHKNNNMVLYYFYDNSELNGIRITTRSKNNCNYLLLSNFSTTK